MGGVYETQFRSMWRDTSGAYAGIYDVAGNCLWVSNAVEEVLGYTREEYKRSNMWCYVAPEDLSKALDALVICTQRGRKKEGGACLTQRLVHKDGSRVKCAVTVSIGNGLSYLTCFPLPSDAFDKNDAAYEQKDSDPSYMNSLLAILKKTYTLKADYCLIGEVMKGVLSLVSLQYPSEGSEKSVSLGKMDASLSSLLFQVDAPELEFLLYSFLKEVLKRASNHGLKVQIKVLGKKEKVPIPLSNHKCVCVEAQFSGKLSPSLKLKSGFEGVCDTLKAYEGHLIFEENSLGKTVIRIDIWLALALGNKETQGHSVLIIDDSKSVRKLSSRICSQMGCKVSTAESGEEGLILLKKHVARPYDFVFTDIDMYQMNGLQMTSQGRKSGYKGKIIAMSASKYPRNKVLQAGCDEFYAKPVSKTTMHQILAKRPVESDKKNLQTGWYVRFKDKSPDGVLGPLSLEFLKTLIRIGAIGRDTELCNQKIFLGSWIRADDFLEFREEINNSPALPKRTLSAECVETIDSKTYKLGMSIDKTMASKASMASSLSESSLKMRESTSSSSPPGTLSNETPPSPLPSPSTKIVNTTSAAKCSVDTREMEHKRAQTSERMDTKKKDYIEKKSVMKTLNKFGLMSFLDQVPLPVVIMNRRGLVCYVNKDFLTLTEYHTPQQLIGMHDLSLKDGSPHNAKEPYAKINKVQAKGNEWVRRRGYMTCLKTKSGRVKKCEVYTMQIAHFSLAVMQEVASNDGLAALKFQLTNETVRINRLKGGIDAFAHDVRTPLHALLNISQELKELIKSKPYQKSESGGSMFSDDSWCSDLDYCARSILTLATTRLALTKNLDQDQASIVVSDVLSMAKKTLVRSITTFQLGTNSTPQTPTTHHTDQTKPDTRAEDKDKCKFKSRLDFQNQLMLEGKISRTQAVGLFQIIANLVTNAWAANPSCTATVTVTGEEQGHNGLLLKVVVKDDGNGVPQEVSDYLMGKTDVKPTKGLGVHIIRRNVRDLGGSIECRNNQGTLIDIVLYFSSFERVKDQKEAPPKFQPLPAQSAEVRMRKSGSWGGRMAPGRPELKMCKSELWTRGGEFGAGEFDKCRILAVDDNVVNRKILVHILRNRCKKLTVLDLASKAIEESRRSVYDVILMDIVMDAGQMNGIDAVRFLRRSGYKGWIIAVTGHSLTESEFGCPADGFNDSLYKPFTKYDLYQKISDAWRSLHGF